MFLGEVAWWARAGVSGCLPFALSARSTNCLAGLWVRQPIPPLSEEEEGKTEASPAPRCVPIDAR